MPDSFSPDDLVRVARLARLSLTTEEQGLFTRQLAEIIRHIEHIQSVDTSQVPPASHPSAETGGAWRDDEVRPSIGREHALDAAPDADRETGFFKVPRVLGS